MRIRVSDISSQFESTSLFVCVASFEDRCRIIAENLNPEIESVFIFGNIDYAEYISANSQAIKARFQRDVRMISIRTDDPLTVADKLRDELVPAIKKSDGLCLIDVTTFTHEQLLILMRLLMDNCGGANIKFIYNHASSYSSNTEANNFWLSKGVSRIRAVLGYPGEMLPSKRSHLIVLAGYEYERAQKLITRLEPSLISLGLGRKEEHDLNRTEYERNKLLNDQLELFVEGLSASITSVIRFEFSTSNPLTAKDEILEQCNRYSAYNVCVAPMNTKLSTIGAGLAGASAHRIQLTYAQPITYNVQGYSLPSDVCTVFDFSPYLRGYTE